MSQSGSDKQVNTDSPQRDNEAQDDAADRVRGAVPDVQLIDLKHLRSLPDMRS